MDLNQYIQYYIEHNHFMREIGIRPILLETGHAEVELEIQVNSLNINGTLHGGVIFTMADVAAGCAARSHGISVTTLSSNINFIKTAQSGKVRAIANEIHKGRTTGVYRVEVFGEKDLLLAVGTFTFFFTGKPIEAML